MKLSTGLRALALGLLSLVAMAASEARAEWRKAESERFIVYSEGDQGQLIQFTRKLDGPHGGEAAEAAQALLDRARGLSAAEAAAERAAADRVSAEPEGQVESRP